MTWKPTVVATEKERSSDSFAKIKDISSRFPRVHLHIGRRCSRFCFVYVVACCCTGERLLTVINRFKGRQEVAAALPAKSLQKATWRKTLFWAQKKNCGEQRVMMALVLFHLLALVLFSEFS
jgi:hypothetical protein